MYIRDVIIYISHNSLLKRGTPLIPLTKDIISWHAGSNVILNFVFWSFSQKRGIKSSERRKNHMPVTYTCTYDCTVYNKT